EHASVEAQLRERNAQLRGYHHLTDQLFAAVQQLEGSGQAILGGASAQAPRDPESLGPFFEAVARILAFAARQEKIALSIEETIGRRGTRPIDGESLGTLLKELLRGTTAGTEEPSSPDEPTTGKPRAQRGASAPSREQSLPLIEAKLGYLGLIPAAL